MLFQDENVLAKLPKGSPFQQGISNADSDRQLEADTKLPFAKGRASWVYYDVALGCKLDSGIVVHRTLPQQDTEWDTLAACDIYDEDIDKLTGRGVNLESKDKFQDTVQRMAHSQYWFRLWGQAMRIGEQIPIPGVKSIGGVDAVPYDQNPQWAFNKIVGNYSGVVLWYAQWSLWYTLAEPPRKDQTPPQNLFQHIAGDAKPEEMQAPWSQPDQNAVPTMPPLQSGLR